jgi:hypothetical protein
MDFRILPERRTIVMRHIRDVAHMGGGKYG